jgi:isoleucyl-tRNA synthetase
MLLQYGPDVLRLWIVLSDYKSDVVFSKESMDSASKQYFKLRNWMRYFVNNLYREHHDHSEVSGQLVGEVLELRTVVAQELEEHFNPSKAFRAIVTFLGNYSSRLNEPLKDRFYESELDAPLRELMENEFHYVATHVGRMLFPFAPFLSMELAAALKSH